MLKISLHEIIHYRMGMMMGWMLRWGLFDFFYLGDFLERIGDRPSLSYAFFGGSSELTNDTFSDFVVMVDSSDFLYATTL